LITKELLKAEIDRIPDEYLEILYKILKALETPTKEKMSHEAGFTRQLVSIGRLDWHRFIAETYGSLADAPIQRGDQGKFEKREALE